jgi:hypothetical protein
MTIRLGQLGELHRWTKADHLGHLHLFVKPHVEEMQTQFGDQDAAVCEAILCVTCELGWEDQVVFGSYLVPRICSGDDLVPGVLVQGRAQAGKNAPWLLDDPTAEDRTAAQNLADRVITGLGSGKLVVDLDALKGRHEEPL